MDTETTKKCSTCGAEKPVSEFYINRARADGHQGRCKICHRACCARWLSTHAKEHQKNTLIWQKKNPEKSRASSARYRLAHPEKIREYNAKSYAENRETERKRSAKWFATNLEKSREYSKKWGGSHREHTNKHLKNRRETDHVYALVLRLRGRIHVALRKTQKASRTLDLVGCTRTELVTHIESQFQPGMSWENRRLWHLDHIRPCASFDLTDPEQQRLCFHFSNLRPLWAGDNLRKGSKYNKETTT
jgi:hypothetical protein